MTWTTLTAAKTLLRLWMRNLQPKRNRTPIRRTTRLALEWLEDRCTPSAVSWTGGANTLNWSDSGNWSSGAVPTSSDDVTISAAVSGPINIVAGSYAVRTLNDTSAQLSIASDGSLSLAAVSANSTFGQNVTVQSGGSLTVGAGASLLIGPPPTSNGTLTLADNGTLTFSDGDTVTLNSDYGDYATTQIAVGSGGTCNATGTTFNAAAGSDTTQIVVNSGSTITTSNNVFNITLVVPAIDVPLLTNNQSFHDVDVASGDSLSNGQSVTLTAMGTVSTANLRYVLPGNFTINAGATLAVDSNVSIVMGPPAASNGTLTLADNGTLNFASGDTVTLNSDYGTATTQIVVSSGGTLDADGATFKAGAGSYISQIVIDSGAIVTTSNNVFNLPLFVPAIDVPLLTNNQSFEDVNINPGDSLSNGQSVTLTLMGTVSTANLLYLFPGNFTINAGATLAVASNVPIAMGPPSVSNGTLTLADDGTLTFASGDIVTLNSDYGNATTQIVVGNGGLLNASGATFNAGGGSYLSQIAVSSGGHMTGSNNTFALTQVDLADGCLLNSGDLTNNVFNTTLYTPILDVPLLTNNQSFHDVDINPGDSLANGQSVTLTLMGTVSTANLLYVFPGNFTINSGATLAVASNVPILMGPPPVPNGTLTLADNGTLTFASGDTVTLNSDYSDYATTQIVVGSGGSLTASGAAFIAAPGADTSQVAVNSGGKMMVSNSLLLENGALLVNNSGAILNLTNDATVSESGGGTLINAGTLEKTGGTGIATISSYFDNNSGTINVQTGTLTLDSAGGINTGGIFKVSTNATLDLTGGAMVAYKGTYTGSGAGKVVLKNGTLQVATGGATFNMAGSLLQWSGGTIDVTSGSFTNTNTITYSGSGNAVLYGAGSLINKKSFVQTSTGTLALNNGATLYNYKGGTYNIESDGGIGVSNGGTLTNTGTLEKTKGTNTSTISTSTLNNTGTVAVSSGTLDISATVNQVSGSTLTAGAWTATGSTLTIASAGSITTIGSKAKVTLSGLNSSFTNINGASGLNKILAGGSFSILNGQSFTTAGNFSNAGSVILTGGTLTITGTVAQLSGTSLTGGTWTVGANSNLNFPTGANITSLAGAKVTLNGADSSFAALADLATIGKTSSFSLLGGQSFTTVGALTNNGALTLSPGSILTVSGSFTQSSTGKLAIQLGGTDNSPTFGQLVSTSGTVALAGGLSVTSTVVPAIGSAFEILANQGGSPISGTFAGLAEGGTFTVKKGSTTMTFRISYVGDGGNNAVITRIS